MWVMLRKRVPVEKHKSPPKLSIFWGVPWIKEEWAIDQLRYCQNCGHHLRDRKRLETEAGVPLEKALEAALIGVTNHLEEIFEDENCCDHPQVLRPTDEFVWRHFGGTESNWLGALKIVYRGEDIRVFPHEYSVVSAENLSYYIQGDAMTKPWELVTEAVPGATNLQIAKFLEQDILQDIVDAAMLDGATQDFAKLVALGANMDPDLVVSQVPVAGWYRCVDENVIDQFCYEDEVIEYEPETENIGSLQ